jgi:hypothetical protein
MLVLASACSVQHAYVLVQALDYLHRPAHGLAKRDNQPDSLFHRLISILLLKFLAKKLGFFN